jgi:hypothetical protein
MFGFPLGAAAFVVCFALPCFVPSIEISERPLQGTFGLRLVSIRPEKSSYPE